MEWTKEKPTQEGYYWMCSKTWTIFCEVYFLNNGQAGVRYIGTDVDDSTIPNEMYWYGPISPPEFKE